MAHTPGPWHAGPKDWLISQSNGMGYRNFTIRGVEEFDIAMVYCDEDDDEQAANVSLIAAAPELLAALKLLVREAQALGCDCSHITPVINKAEGRSE
jgi:hypothetical protein